MADNVSKIYEIAKKKGVLADGLTEDMFRQQTATEDGLKSFYDYASQNGMTFRGFDEFKTAFYKKPNEQAEQPASTTMPTGSKTPDVKETPLTDKDKQNLMQNMELSNIASGAMNYAQQLDGRTQEMGNTNPLATDKSLVSNIGKANQSSLNTSYQRVVSENTIDENLKRLGELDKKVKEEWDNMSKADKMAFAYSKNPIASMTPLQSNVSAAYGFVNKAQTMLKDVRERNNFIGGAKKIADIDTWDHGISELQQDTQLLNAVKKYERGDKLSEDETVLMDAAANYMLISALYSDKLSRSFKAGSVTAQSIPFMIEFLISPLEGISELTMKGLSRWAAKSFAKGVVEKAVKTVFIKAPAMTAIWGGTNIAAGTVERQVGTVLNKIDEENGRIVFDGTIGGQSLPGAVYSSFVDTYVENLSEMIFEPFAGLGGKTASIIAKSSSPAIKAVSSAMSKIGGSKAAQVFNKCYNNPFVKTIRDRAHFSGYLGEVAEEEVGGLLRLIAPYNDVTNMEEAGLDWDSQIDTFLGLAPTSILFGGLGLAGAGIQATSRELNIVKYRNGILNAQNSDEAREEAKKVIKYTLSRKDISRDTKADILRSAYYAYQQKVADDIQHEQYEERAAKEQEQDEIKNNIREQAAEDGNIYPVTLNGDTETEYRIASGNFEIDENGKIVSDEPIVIKWEDEKGEWKRKQVTADELTISDEIVRAEDAVRGLEINVEAENIVNEEEQSKKPSIADAYFEKDGEVRRAAKVGDKYVLEGTEDEFDLETLVAMGFNPTTDVPELVEQNKNKVVIQASNGTFFAERNEDGTLTVVSDADGNSVEDAPVLSEQAWLDNGATITPYNDYVQSQQLGNVPSDVQQEVISPDVQAQDVTATETQDVNANETQDNNTAQKNYPTDENGEPAWNAMPDSETFAQAAIEEAGGDVNIASNFIKDVLIPQADEALKQAQAAQKKKPTATSLKGYSEELKAKNDAVNAADNYRKMLDLALTAIGNIGKQKEIDAAIEKTKKRAATEVGVAGETMKERFDNATKIDGFARTMTLKNGTKLKGKYLLIDAFGLTPSHDSLGNFTKKEGYPTTTDGQSINDRDYEHSQAEQGKVQKMAAQYDGQAIDEVPVISNEGLVYGGNGRTMGGQLAAKNGTDSAYMTALMENCHIFGFTEEQVASVPNARVVFMLDENLPYNTTSLAMFNENGMQTMNASELAQSITRKMNDKGVGHIVGMINGHESIDDFFKSNDAVTLIDYLISDGIISQADKNEMLNSDGKLSKTGQEILSAIMLGTALKPDVIRLLEKDVALRNNIIKALPTILENKAFEENLRIIDKINNAIRAIFDMRNYKLSLSEFMNQLIIETDENGNAIQKTAADNYSAYELLLAEAMLSGKKTDFVNQIAEYNKMAKDVSGGQLNIFDEVTTKEDIINSILRINGKEQSDSTNSGANSEEQRETSGDVKEGSGSSKEQNSAGSNKEDVEGQRPIEDTQEPTDETPAAETSAAEQETDNTEETTAPTAETQEDVQPIEETTDPTQEQEAEPAETTAPTEEQRVDTEEKEETKQQVPSEEETNTPSNTISEETQVKEEKPKNKVEVSENRLVDDNLYLKNIEILRRSLNNLNSGLNPEVMSAGAIVACYHIERGARTFVAYSKAMMKDLGDVVKPYLKSFYLSAMYMPGMEQFKNEMDSFDFVQAFDVETIKAEDESSNDDADLFVSSIEQEPLSESEELASDAVLSALNNSSIETEYVSQEELSEKLGGSKDVEFLRTPEGVVYGWASNGKIYLTKDGINPNTPIHEYTHLWVKAIKEKNSALYASLEDIFSRSNFGDMYDELDNDPNYSSLSEEAKMSEVIARFSGKQGAERMTQEAEKIINEHPTISRRAQVRMLIAKAKKLIEELWSWVGKNLFSISDFGSAEEVADRVMYDLFNNTNLNTGEKDTMFNKPIDEESDWQAELDFETYKPYTIREKVLDSVIKAASQHNSTAKTLKSAIDVVNSRLREIRKAMNAQKMTDRDAIKKLTKMATIFVKNGWVDASDRRELQNMISAIGRSTEKTFEENARDLLIAVTNAHLNHVERQFNTLRRLRIRKVNISGVTELGNVDVETQYMFEAFNDGIKLTEEELDGYINDAIDQEREAIANGDTAKEMEMRNKVNGYMAAQTYLQTVGELKAENVEMRRALSDAKSKSYAGVAHPILAKREAVSIAKEALIDNMLDLVYAYQEMAYQLSVEKSAGKERATSFRNKIKDNMEKIRHFANSDLQGVNPSEYTDKTLLSKLANSVMAAGALFAPLQALNSMLKGLARKAPNGEGYLYDHFIRGFVDSKNAEEKGIWEMFRELDAKASDIMGKKMSWANMAERLNNGNKLDITILDSRGEKKSIELTQGQLAYIYAVNKMTDGKMKLRTMGITSADMAAIENALSPQTKEIVDWLQDDFLPRARVKYNKVHIDMFGAPMANIENYFPLRINKNSRKEEVDLANDTAGIGNLPGTVTGAIKERRRNNNPIDIMNADAFTVAIEHVIEMEHWAAFCHLNRDANILLSYPLFKNRLSNMVTVYGAGEKLYANLKDAFKVAMGTYTPKSTKASALAVNIAKGVSAAKVTFRLFTAIKQILSRPAFYTEILEGDGSFLMYFAKATCTPASTFKWAMQNLPLFEERIMKRTAGDTRLLSDELDWKIWHSKMYEWCTKIGMSPNAFVDALTCAQGAYAIYMSRKGGYINRGMSEEEADKRALQDAAIKYNETQQSSEGAFVSTMQLDKDVASVAASLFQNANIAYLKRGVEHTYQLYNSIFGVGRKAQVEYLTKKYTRLGYDEASAEKYAKNDYNKSIARNAFGVFLYGYFIDVIWRIGSNMVYLFFGDDDDKKREMLTDAVTGGAFAGPLRGTIVGPGLEAALDGYGWGSIMGGDLPIESDIEKYENLYNSEKKAEFATNIINMAVAIGLGFNPETITNIGVSIIDACDGNLEYANDFMTLIFTIMAVPESQIRELYIDELGTSAEDIQLALKREDYRLKEIASKYAERRKKMSSPIIPMGEEEQNKQEKAARNAIKRGAKERLNTKEQ